MGELLSDYILEISHAIELVSFAIMIYGALFALLHFLKSELKRLTNKFDIATLDVIRHDFAYYILFGLEFLIAADIIQTILKPTSQELIELGGIVVIRILLSYFLNKEIEQVKKLGAGGNNKEE
jgi:uncharacterized membrane protein